MAETKRKYDPVKRREYYLRTRELKGRKKGSLIGRMKKINASRKQLSKQHKDQIRGSVVDIGKRMADLEKAGLKDYVDANGDTVTTPAYRAMEELQTRLVARYFNVEEPGAMRGSGRYTNVPGTDTFIELPNGLTTKHFHDNFTTGNNDIFPDIPGRKKSTPAKTSPTIQKELEKAIAKANREEKDYLRITRS